MIFEIRDIDENGAGLTPGPGGDLPVPGALPGDRVEVSAAGGRRVVAQGPRAPSPCPHRHCPGCPLLSVPYPLQLEAKRRRVVRAFEARGFHPTPPVEAPHGSVSQLGYRAGAKLALARGRAGALVGIYGRGSHRVVDIPRCPVHHPLVAAGTRSLRRLLSRAPRLLAPGPGGGGWLRHAAFAASAEEERLVVTLVTRDDGDPGLLSSLAARLAEEVPRLEGVAWNVNGDPGNAIFGGEWRELRGDGTLRERLGDRVLRISPGSFLQANREQASWVYREAVRWLDPTPGEEVLDLYCGVGGLALHLAPRAGRVVGVEANPAAISDARRAAAESGAAHATFRQGPAEEVLPALLASGFRPGAVALNPPRRGADPAVIGALRGAEPRAILYVSCNPETLARDCALLCRDGTYRMERIRPVDFFPQTAHVETVALLRRAGPRSEP